MNSIKKEITAALIIILLNIGIIFLAYGLNFFFEYAYQFKKVFWMVGVYIFLLILFYQINNRFKSKIVHFLFQLVYLPITLLYLFMIVAIPLLSAQLYLFLFLFLSFLLPISLYAIDKFFFLLGLKTEIWYFIILTTGSISAVLFQKQISFLTFKMLPFTARKSEKINRKKLTYLCEYIVSKENIKLTIYSLFFIALIVFNIFGLQEKSFYENPNFDKAILQSFIAFIAFERIISNLRVTKFLPSNLLYLIKESVFNENNMVTGNKASDEDKK